jgi:putative protease
MSQPSEERLIGKVSHYFSKIGVAVLDLTQTLKVGDSIHIKGHTTDVSQSVASMQIEHETVEQGKPGEAVAIKVDQPVRQGDEVFVKG